MGLRHSLVPARSGHGSLAREKPRRTRRCYDAPDSHGGEPLTLYLWYLELAIIHAVCPVCISLYFLNYALTAVAAVVALGQ